MSSYWYCSHTNYIYDKTTYYCPSDLKECRFSYKDYTYFIGGEKDYFYTYTYYKSYDDYYEKKYYYYYKESTLKSYYSTYGLGFEYFGTEDIKCKGYYCSILNET